jgi:hypothetical protein
LLAQPSHRGESLFLTHRLDLRGDDEREAYYAPGAKFDRLVIELVTSGRSADIHELDPELLREAAPEAALTMQPLYMKKLRGFTRGNIPTPDIPEPSLP